MFKEKEAVKKLRFAVIGAGWWGKKIINTLEQMQEVDGVLVYDKNASAYEFLTGLAKCQCANSLDDVMTPGAVDAVCISSSPQTHYDLSKRALQSGHHVFVEKPPASNVHEVQELGSLAEKKGVVYMIDALYLFANPLRKLKTILDSGELNDIRFVQIFRIGDELRRPGAGINRIRNVMFANNIDVVDDLFYHDAGILVYLFDGLTVKSVRKLFSYDKKLCDTATVEFVCKNTHIEMTLSWALGGRRRGIILYDKDFIVEYDALKEENQLSIFRIADQTVQHHNAPDPPLLKSILEYFIQTIRQHTENQIDYKFMQKVMLLKDEVTRTRGE